jgi:glucarate dehydratase
VGEVPGGEKIRRVLEESRLSSSAGPSANYNAILNACAAHFRGSTTSWPRLQTFDLRTTVHAVTAIEAALLDLLGQFLGVPVAALLGEGQQRRASRCSATCSLSATATRPTCPTAASPTPHSTMRGCACATRRRSPPSVLRLAEAAQARYGFHDFKLKGGVLAGAQEMER